LSHSLAAGLRREKARFRGLFPASLPGPRVSDHV